ncbi:hypothetical protein GCM10010341_80910 [Streptomyces noursei]|nr:hypothetical protein GCM10010341_80910 [Streptomyces noursei]
MRRLGVLTAASGVPGRPWATVDSGGRGAQVSSGCQAGPSPPGRTSPNTTGVDMCERLLALLGADSPLAGLTRDEQGALQRLLGRALARPSDAGSSARG